MAERRWDRDKARETVRKHGRLRDDPWGDEAPVRVGDVYTDRAYRLLWVAAVESGEAVLEDLDGRRQRAPLRPRGGIEGLQRVEVEAQGEASESWESHGLRTFGRLPEVGDAFTFRPDGERLVVEAVDAECVTLSAGRRVPLGSFLGMVGEGTFVKEERWSS